MYKDKERQRQAVRDAVRRCRARAQAVIPCNTQANVIPCNTPDVIPLPVIPVYDVDRDKPIVTHTDKAEPQSRHPMNLCESIRKLPISRLIEEGIVAPLKHQSHSPMMVGYVPPKEQA